MHPGRRYSSWYTAVRTCAVVATLVVAVGACSSGAHTSPHSDPTTRASTDGSGTVSPTSGGDPTGLDVAVKATKLVDLRSATAMAMRVNDDTRYFAQQDGVIRAVRDGRIEPARVLDLTDRVRSGGERGLLGLTFSIDGSHLYVDYTNKRGDTRVDEYAMRGNVADFGSRRELLAIHQPQPNHNGGNVVIGPDGMLWIGMGDGGAGGDQGPGHVRGGNAQSLDTLLGKLLRIDPRPSAGRPYTIPSDNPFAHRGGRPEIWAFGLRNPWRFEFDRATGDLWIADVGQNKWEEVDRVARGRGAGANFGWNRLEGDHPYTGRAPVNTVAPVYEYSHDADGGSCAVTGGFVYRGRAIPGLRGAYLYIDNCAGHLHALRLADDKVAVERDLGVKLRSVSSFGEDDAGELYLLSQSSGVYRLDPA